MRALIILAFMLSVGVCPAIAADPTLVIMEQQFTAAALLARSDGVVLEVPHDVSYGHAMRYFAVPLAKLLRGAAADRVDTLEARASDGFVTQNSAGPDCGRRNGRPGCVAGGGRSGAAVACAAR